MKMTLIRFIMLNIGMLASTCMAGNAENPWYGEYSYFASGGQTAGDSQIMMDITVKISNQGGKEQCKLTADGYQTYDRILCTTVVNKNRLTLQFRSYEDGSIVNPIDVEVYKVSETLFSLEKVVTKNKKKPVRYITHWGAYTPFGLERKTVKDYFEKIK